MLKKSAPELMALTKLETRQPTAQAATAPAPQMAASTEPRTQPEVLSPLSKAVTAAPTGNAHQAGVTQVSLPLDGPAFVTSALNARRNLAVSAR